MNNRGNKHENYELLNLLGYGLAKFDNDFVKQFGFNTKSSFFEYFVEIGIVETGSVVKNRMDLFDPFFENSRKGWWQKGDAYIHRKLLIDSLFGNENVLEYANIVKLFLKDNFKIYDIFVDVKPIVKSRFKKLQETGLEAELYFINTFFNFGCRMLSQSMCCTTLSLNEHDSITLCFGSYISNRLYGATVYV